MGYLGCHERGTKKNSEFPTGIESRTSRTPVGCFNHWATGGLVANGVIWGLRVQWLERPTGVQEFMGSISVVDRQIFSLSRTRDN